jgi:Raf kinase inhibitor-like YbhB/YbcL family protein
MEIKITSSAFANAGEIPSQYTCDGRDISPPLQWESVPPGTQAITLICDDPDAPMGTFVHWVLYNVPPDARELPERLAPEASLPDGAQQGINDFGKTGYGGPCPPSGTHRYFFKIYALDAKVDPGPGPRKSNLVKAMKGHVLAEGQLMGKYRR